MTEIQDNSPPSAPPALPAPSPPRTARRGIVVFIVFLLIAVALGVAAYFFPIEESRLWPAASDDASLRPRVAALEQRIEILDKKVGDLDARVENLASARAPSVPPSSEGQIPKTSASDLARLQSDLVALSAAMGGLQAEVKQAGSAAAAMRAQTQTAIAETVAFMQLRTQAESGHSFANEFSALQTAAANDLGLKEPLGKLAPYADKGAPDLATLREQLTGMTGSVERDVAKAQAQNWWQRVLAELKGLVSIRPLHGTSSPGGTLESMQSDLARGDLAAALDEIKNLPPEAQKSLDDWRAEAEARQTIDAALRAMADGLIAGVHVPAAQGGQDKP